MIYITEGTIYETVLQDKSTVIDRTLTNNFKNWVCYMMFQMIRKNVMQNLNFMMLWLHLEKEILAQDKKILEKKSWVLGG